MRIFYSWQSDLPNAINRGFIETALRKAAGNIARDDGLEVEPVILRDTDGMAGSPNISVAIFSRIEASDVLVSDVSIINGDQEGRPCPNPNVLIELGYGLKALGEGRVIQVMNTGFGTPEVLPFDLRMRRTITYNLPDSETDRGDERSNLVRNFERGIRSIIETLGPLEDTVADPFEVATSTAIQSILNQRPDQVARCRDFFSVMLDCLKGIAPQRNDEDEWDEQLVNALPDSMPIVAAFARVAGTAAEAGAGPAIMELYSKFGCFVDLYDVPPDYIGSYRKTDWDFFRFLGHELFVTLFSALIENNRLSIAGKLLGDPLICPNPRNSSNRVVSFSSISEIVETLNIRNRRLELNRTSVHADILKDRHLETELATVTPFQSFLDAEYFLFLRGAVEQSEPYRWSSWPPWSALYLEKVPTYLLKATSGTFAEELASSLGAPDVKTLKVRLKERGNSYTELFRSAWVYGVLEGFDMGIIGSRE